MRIVATADTHGYHEEIAELPAGDVFVHAGDLTRRGTVEELQTALDWIRGLPYAHKIVVAGNHDWLFERDPARARCLVGADLHYLQDSAVHLEGVRFWGSPWQPAYMNWAFNLPRGVALAERWARIPRGIDVLVTHGPPEGFGDRASFGSRKGCADLLERVRAVRPLLHLFGHIHEDGGFWTRAGVAYANVTSWECERPPTVVDLDPRSSRVVPRFVPPPL